MSSAKPDTRAGALVQSFGAMGPLIPGLAFAAALAYLSVRIEPLTTRATIATLGMKITITAPVIALLIGMVLHPIADRPTFTVGPTFAIKKVLRWAIALFGLKIALADILGLGLGTAFMVIVAMAATLVSGVLFARLFGRGDLYGAIAGGATASAAPLRRLRRPRSCRPTGIASPTRLSPRSRSISSRPSP